MKMETRHRFFIILKLDITKTIEIVLLFGYWKEENKQENDAQKIINQASDTQRKVFLNQCTCPLQKQYVQQ